MSKLHMININYLPAWMEYIDVKELSRGVYDSDLYFGADYIYLHNIIIPSSDVSYYSHFFSESANNVFESLYKASSTFVHDESYSSNETYQLQNFINTKRYGYLLKQFTLAENQKILQSYNELNVKTDNLLSQYNAETDNNQIYSPNHINCNNLKSLNQQDSSMESVKCNKPQTVGTDSSYVTLDSDVTLFTQKQDFKNRWNSETEQIDTCSFDTPKDLEGFPDSQDNINPRNLAYKKVGSYYIKIVSQYQNINNRDVKVSRQLFCPLKGCTKSYTRLSHLKSHIDIHEGVRQYKCTWLDCFSCFPRKDQLIRHLSSHAMKPMHICKVCNTSFSRRQQLVKHESNPH